MATSDEDLEAYEGEDSKNSEDVMLIEEEERVDSGDEVVEDSKGVSHVLEGTADIPTKFLPLEKAKSLVWEYFGFPARSGVYVEKDKCRRKEVFCTLCVKPLNYTGSTTNMIVHLQYHHEVEYNELVSVQISSKRRVVKPPLLKGQASIEESFGKLLPLSHSSARWKSLTNAVCQFLARDLVPIMTLDFGTCLRCLSPGILLLIKPHLVAIICPERKKQK